MARIINGLPRWAPFKLPLKEVGLPPLSLYLDMLTQRYGARILRPKDSHPCNKLLIHVMNSQGLNPRNGTSLDRIAALLLQIIGDHQKLEDSNDCTPRHFPNHTFLESRERKKARNTEPGLKPSRPLPFSCIRTAQRTNRDTRPQDGYTSSLKRTTIHPWNISKATAPLEIKPK